MDSRQGRPRGPIDGGRGFGASVVFFLGLLLAACAGDERSPDPGTGTGSGTDACDLTQDDSCERLVDHAWLAAHLDDSELQIVDVRAENAYEAGRIPGALRLDVGSLRATVAGIPGQVADRADVQDVLRSIGVLSSTNTVVIYDSGVGTTPARALWTLEYYGHQDVRLLDGGFEAWTAAGQRTSSGRALIPVSDYEISVVAAARRVDADWIHAKLQDPALVLIDARSAGEFSAGRIPGARNVDWQDLVSDGRLISRADALAAFSGVLRYATVVVYCQSGKRASLPYFVLRWLGYEDVRLYDGSWAEWDNRADLPKDSG